MKTIRGPAVFLAQFVDSKEPFNSLDGRCKWAANLGYKGIQIPTWEPKLIVVGKAAESKTYCGEIKGKVATYGLEITELASHLQGQLVTVHPAYDIMFDSFAPEKYWNNPKARTEWAVQQLKNAAKAIRNWELMYIVPLVVPCYGTRLIPGRNGRRAWWRWGLRNWLSGGCQF